jgi:hypothetical protein
VSVTADVIAAARNLDRALDETVEHALWLDIGASRRVYRARCRLGRAIQRLDISEASPRPSETP